VSKVTEDYTEYGLVDGDGTYLSGLPRKCPKCGTWSRYEKKKLKCFTVECPGCFHNFEIVKNARGFRK
jgi:hypothetical protein